MPSKTFQPLLFDLLTYKLPNTTYFDHYCKKKRRIYANGASAAARTASTANLSQKQKMALMMKRSRPFTSTNQLYEAYKANLVYIKFNNYYMFEYFMRRNYMKN